VDKCCQTGDSCYNFQCVKGCSPSQITCGESCCDPETEKCTIDIEIVKGIEVEKHVCTKKCESETTSCGLGGLCCTSQEECVSVSENERTVSKCLEKCTNGNRCGETCCSSNEECVPTSDNGFSKLKCVPPCPNKTPMTYRCGDGTECCERRVEECTDKDHHIYDDNKTIVGCHCGWKFESCSISLENGSSIMVPCCTCQGHSAVQADGSCKERTPRTIPTIAPVQKNGALMY
jgi:hypothetical protein